VPLSDAEIRAGVALERTRWNNAGPSGPGVVDNVPLRLGRGELDCINDAARRAAVADGIAPNQHTFSIFAAGALRLAAQAIASPSADDQVRLNRAGW
jgi:hypothetical protein